MFMIMAVAVVGVIGLVFLGYLATTTFRTQLVNTTTTMNESAVAMERVDAFQSTAFNAFNLLAIGCLIAGAVAIWRIFM